MLKQATCAREMKFRGGNNTEQKKKLNNLAPKACFTNAASQRGTALNHVQASLAENACSDDQE